MKQFKKQLLWIFSVAIFVYFSQSTVFAQEDLKFKPNDRWVVIGDSITHNGFYHRFIELFYCTRCPELNLRVTNAGISGDTAGGGLRRWEWDCLPYRPTITSIMFGMNDFGSKMYSENLPPETLQAKHESILKNYISNMSVLMDKFKESKVRAIIILPSPFDDTVELKKPIVKGAGAALAKFAEELKKLAIEKGFPYVDFNASMRLINEERQKVDPKFSIVGGDRVHPTKINHLVMAYYFLKAQQAPSVVYSVIIDANMGKSVQSENCDISNLSIKQEGGAFTILQKSLPFPVDSDVTSALELVPFTQDFNREMLQFNGLIEGNYRLKIDGQLIKSYSSRELGEGINLATINSTPQYKQAAEIGALLTKKYEVASKVRNIAALEHYASNSGPSRPSGDELEKQLQARVIRLKGTPHETSAIEGLARYRQDKPQEATYIQQLETIQDEIWATNKPRTHVYSLEKEN